MAPIWVASFVPGRDVIASANLRPNRAASGAVITHGMPLKTHSPSRFRPALA